MEDKSGEEIAKASRFAAFKGEFKEIIDNIRSGIDRQMDTVPMVQTEFHTKLILTRQLLNNMEKYINTVIETGKLAQYTIQQEEQKKKFWQR